MSGTASGIDRDLDALRRVLEGGRFGSEDATVAFEQALTARTRLAHAVTTSSGSTAIELTLRALEIGPGAEVIVPAFTCRAVSDAVAAAGARPVYADVVWPPGTVDADTVARVIGPRARAVVVVDVYGAPAPVAAVAEVARHHDITVILDVAQSFGSGTGGAGTTGADVVVTSFHPSKVLAAGEGGAVLTDRPELADQVRYLRSPGALQVRLGRPVDGGIGRSLRMSDLDAALATRRLEDLSSVVAARRDAATRWAHELERAGSDLTFPDPDGHAFSTFPVALGARDRGPIIERLQRIGIRATAGYRPLHRLQGGADLCPTASRLGQELLCLPTHAGVSGAVQVTADLRVEAVRAIAAPPQR